MIFRNYTIAPYCLLAWLFVASASWGQVPAEKKLPLAHAFQDNGKCVHCHERGVYGSDFLGENAETVWQKYDKHRDAFRLLYMGRDENDVAGAKAKQALVSRILGFDLADAFEDAKLTMLSQKPALQAKVATVRQCLNCHATWPQESQTAHPPVPLDLGVSCQACHGPGLQWTDPHAYPWWRLVTPQGKESLGFKDVRDPAERARVCASCHVGNYAEGKFVTHAWYAGGHPPLPSFEYSTFATQMPVHWRSLADKANFAGREANNPLADLGVDQRARLRAVLNTDVPEDQVRVSYREANFPAAQFGQHDPFTDLPRLKEAVVSGAVVLEAYAKLVKEYTLAAQAPTGGADQAARPAWPEFALYDCASCHHELKSGSVFPERPLGKNPLGRPPAQVWPMALAKLGVLHSVQYDPQAAAEPLKSLEQAQQDFERAITATVFGDPEKIRISADALQVELTKLIERLKYSRYDDASARHALLLLTDKAQVETRDYHSARQIAWAVRQINKDYARLPYSRGAAEPAAQLIEQLLAIEQLFDVAKEPGQPAVDVLALKLPATRQQSIVDQLQITLPAISHFDSVAFARRLAELNSQYQMASPSLPPLRPRPQ
ncbi:hypothetical protein ETAA8_36740 [Anatilimnocola aggregata]|uniref:Cytochrome c-552/4 domain-containing protein n=1 Tax=Anatilimnocola aggregata TaxID=2528021 RepID=A0A517YEC3_9BACT|nr:multiheme c-type cytochrome [Anatilimnocola aggregata]QDU28571.1 hypothetical protein ETAA8_36740 [Anatilimnocola aggregata]